MIGFETFTPENIRRLRDRLSEDAVEFSTVSLAYTWPWCSRWYSMEFGESHGCGVLRFHFGDHVFYSLPFGGGDKCAALGELLSEPESIVLSNLGEGDFAALGEGWLKREVPLMHDYVYRVSDLAELKGSRYQQKRNHIHRFEDRGEWEYRVFTEENRSELTRDARRVFAEWSAAKTERNDEFYIESTALERVLDCIERGEGEAMLRAVGGVLYSCSRPVAFALGEPLSERMMLASYEKAVTDVQGAYPAVTREFCRVNCRGYEFVNRAGADGNENLVKAKESWHPCDRPKKFNAVRTRAEFATHAKLATCADSAEFVTAADRDEIAALWQRVFGDPIEGASYFIDHLKPDDYILVIRERGEIASACFFLQLEDDIRYIYALMTRPESRGRGYARELINAARSLDFSTFAVVPGEPSLVPFYESLGFTVSSPAETRTVALDDFAREFYLRCGWNGTDEIRVSSPTLTSPCRPGYAVPLPLN